MPAQSPGAPTVSVVVPTRNRVAGLADVLSPLLADDATDELIVVDDGSSDTTGHFLAQMAAADPRVRVVQLEGRGAAAARQAGVEAATGTIVLFVDDDVVAAPGLVSGHRRQHAVVGYMPVRLGRHRPADGATFLYHREYEDCCRAWERDPSTILTRFWAGNVSLRRDRCLMVPLPSPYAAIAYHEDEDFGLRLRAAGVPAVFDRSLLAEHRYERPLQAFLLDAYRQGADRWHLRRAYPDLEETLGWSLVPKAFPYTGGPRVQRAVLTLACTLAGRARRFRLRRVEVAALRVARRLERRRGYRDAARGVESVASR
jgi:glycosyltransferase involved in cell wall biosynthesis